MIVLTTPSSGGIQAFSVAKSYYPTVNHGSTTTAATNSKYDSSFFSNVTDSHDRFQRELVSRLSHEVRTATTTGRIQELRRAVSAGEYHPDAEEIAKRLLFHVEGL